mmetsp:Transcript_37682/g.53139  ORF Transcript_37682/g.53139 Transcript_37682/m.53139 type:complete len:174 (-) Transcript_37682:70-591(-)|eukprot:CAMPEP_0202444308 /NCGR_PEP_ID=MMETSP1360-20130828/3436_1 /ASSEMBLY_ACC=CAM_ASM_000848 /TAXON_ID=515479 /ORGANISM="Licmophora paradoxa, Strain CCMP2313" /LENGTH=173 /DNA_ID=CAMNT_0049060277 /DNA_START=16 /DNA_END=537 /DNA_ORIENTATION=+
MTVAAIVRTAAIVTLWGLLHHQTFAFNAPRKRSQRISITTYFAVEEDDEVFILSKTEPLDDDLIPPPINIRKESILFGDSPSTKRNNNAIRLWNIAKSSLPRIMTGARTPTTGDDNPMGALYNIIFVRLPIIAAGFIYVYNLFHGHGLVIDLGQGPLTVNPLIAFCLWVLLLR